MAGRAWSIVVPLATVLLAAAVITRQDTARAEPQHGGGHGHNEEDTPVPKYCQYTINLAAKGYDVVSYFSLDASANGTKGSSEFTLQFNNATFYFESAENRDTFKANPWKYHPAFGGFCAFGMAKFPSTLKELHEQPPIGPPICPLTQWTVFNGTLYLNDCATRDQWLASRDEFIHDAERRWHQYFGAQHAGPTNIDCFGP